ncbi:MAG: MaoC family dehydratase N-terminal domain-containing protein [Arenibacterium sp.]
MTQHLTDWIGKQETRKDVLSVQPARFMQATLDHDPSLRAGDTLPTLWHWLYFLEAKRLSELGRDAHSKKGGFLPPVELPRRMWAGGRLQFHAPLILGEPAEKTSTIKSVVEKTGKSGPLCFVTVEHLIHQNGQLALSEEHDIVYRSDPAPDAPRPVLAPAPEAPDFSETVQPSEVILFRYSALTFNGHRIHYDVDYARSVEGYDGLVFHGPLTATLLANQAETRSGKRLTTFTFTARAPLAGMTPFELQGRRSEQTHTLWARRQDGACAMEATAGF